jgi:hypothetical protein
MKKIRKILSARGKRYGEYSEHARITQRIKAAFRDSPNWDKLSDDKKETFDMLAHKSGRILNGDPEFPDSWDDILGYGQLSRDRLRRRRV